MLSLQAIMLALTELLVLLTDSIIMARGQDVCLDLRWVCFDCFIVLLLRLESDHNAGLKAVV